MWSVDIGQEHPFCPFLPMLTLDKQLKTAIKDVRVGERGKPLARMSMEKSLGWPDSLSRPYL
jgi:hypothetical protein